MNGKFLEFWLQGSRFIKELVKIKQYSNTSNGAKTVLTKQSEEIGPGDRQEHRKFSEGVSPVTL